MINDPRLSESGFEMRDQGAVHTQRDGFAVYFDIQKRDGKTVATRMIKSDGFYDMTDKSKNAHL